jgi:thiamine biosynthesis protein ThiI
MKLIVKVFPSVTLKSRPVRKRLIRQLEKNTGSVLPERDHSQQVSG